MLSECSIECRWRQSQPQIDGIRLRENMMTSTTMQGDNIGNACVLQPCRHNAEGEGCRWHTETVAIEQQHPLYTSIGLTNTFKGQKTEVDEHHK